MEQPSRLDLLRSVRPDADSERDSTCTAQAAPDAAAERAVQTELSAKRVGKYEVKKACNVFLYGNFVELVDTTIHPTDCICVMCVPQLEKKRQPYDELYVKQKADTWR